MKISTRKDAKAIGETRYFTGSPCKYGHISERFTSNAMCAECANMHGAAWKASNKAAVIEASARYYADNKVSISARHRAHHAANSTEINARKRRVYAGPGGETIKRGKAEKASGWRSTVAGKAQTFMYNSLARVLKTEKNGRTEAILGYSRLDLISHLEALFLPGMTWQNHGDWHIDHIHPISAYLSEGVTDPSVINALSNLQPLWAADNISKGAKVQ